MQNGIEFVGGNAWFDVGSGFVQDFPRDPRHTAHFLDLALGQNGDFARSVVFQLAHWLSVLRIVWLGNVGRNRAPGTERIRSSQVA